MPRDIEEFLKMAAKRRQQQKKQAGKPAAARPPSTGQSQPQRKSPQRRPTAQRQSPIRPATDDEIVIIGGNAETPDIYNQSVSDHVSSHINTQSLSQHASELSAHSSRLGSKVALADDKLEARLQSKFEHKIGELKLEGSAHSTTTTTTEKDVSYLAKELLTMLSNPDSVRQAIVLAEILKRPDFDAL